MHCLLSTSFIVPVSLIHRIIYIIFAVGLSPLNQQIIYTSIIPVVSVLWWGVHFFTHSGWWISATAVQCLSCLYQCSQFTFVDLRLLFCTETHCLVWFLLWWSLECNPHKQYHGQIDQIWFSVLFTFWGVMSVYFTSSWLIYHIWSRFWSWVAWKTLLLLPDASWVFAHLIPKKLKSTTSQPGWYLLLILLRDLLRIYTCICICISMYLYFYLLMRLKGW